MGRESRARRHADAGRLHLVATVCPRCGKDVMTGNRSLSGADETRRKYARICSDCITSEEEREIEAAILGAMLRQPVGG